MRSALFLALIAAAPASAAEIIPPQPVDGKISWVYDYAAGKEQARKADKPLFVVIRCER